MGSIFFEKNRLFPKREYSDLPPGTISDVEKRQLPNFTRKMGILYLGSTRYPNSGFKTFMTFSEKYKESYNFFVLSGDQGLDLTLPLSSIHLDKLDRKEIPKFIQQNNIAYALHTRPRNMYDDITFPIKVLDFISLQIPFISERHLPLINLLSIKYDLFMSFDDLDFIHSKIQTIGIEKYKEYSEMLYQLSIENTYDRRYKKLLTQ
ncbi:MAG: hypothetical protein RH981_15140 [Arenibacter sp.]